MLAGLVITALADGTTEALQPLIIEAVQRANRAIWDHAQSIGSDMDNILALLMSRALYIPCRRLARYLATPTGLKLVQRSLVVGR